MSVDCPCEDTKQSEFSPCTVSDGEEIVYILLDPDQWHQGELAPTAFSKTRLKNRDLSVCRAEYTTVRMAQEEVVDPQVERDSARTCVGALSAKALEIRSISEKSSGVRVFCVIDAGEPKNPGHAHIGFSEATRAPGFWNTAIVGDARSGQVAARTALTVAFSSTGGPRPLTTCLRSETDEDQTN